MSKFDKPTVLIVDDEDAIRLSLVAYLEDEYFTVLEAESGERALQILESHEKDRIYSYWFS